MSSVYHDKDAAILCGPYLKVRIMRAIKSSLQCYVSPRQFTAQTNQRQAQSTQSQKRQPKDDSCSHFALQKWRLVGVSPTLLKGVALWRSGYEPPLLVIGGNILVVLPPKGCFITRSQINRERSQFRIW